MRYIIGTVMIFTVSCIEQIEIELNESYSRLVVEGSITNEKKSHTVKLSKTKSYFSNEAVPTVTGAIVTINDGINTYSLNDTNLSGLYHTDSTVKGEIGMTYTLTIKLENEIYVAEAYLDTVSNLDSLSYKKDKRKNYVYHLKIYIQEIPGVGNYYMRNYYVNNVLITDKLSNIKFIGDKYGDGNYINGLETDAIGAKKGDTIKYEISSISKEQYDFFTAIMQQTVWLGDPFDPPPANIPTNISNGALGFFGASAVTSKTVILKE